MGRRRSPGIYLFDKEALIRCLDNDLTDFGQNVIPASVDSHKIQAHFFDGYWKDIGTIGAFYDAHMDMVQSQPPFDFYDPQWPFFTHPRYLPGSMLTDCRFNQSILAGGAHVADATIEQSVIGVRAVVNKATVKRSLIMGAEDFPAAVPDAPPVGIGEGSLIQEAIVDLNARIGRNVRLVNKDRLTEGEGPGWLIRDGIVVVPKNSVVPDGTTI